MFSTGYIKQMWIATFILLVLWALSYIVTSFLRGKRVPSKRGSETGVGVSDVSTREHPFHWRAADGSRVALATFLMLFAATEVTERGYGPTKATIILAWIFFVISVIHIVLATATRHAIAHTGIGFVQFALIIAIFALAFREQDDD
ncbi:hypothetical protein HK097_002763 [Rhizophlyctis rosea]|uniref:Uncharacterized protein n=1 Tax=Rhizophlyctis rosea TaxID=64517 RepID=A0AAD5S4D3_9FUNG|nr:hypothetical protein HK097_002763 [Rhizophlyctis rosea]